MATRRGQATLDFKVILIGDSNVGKSSLLTYFKDGRFDKEVLTTCRAEYSRTMVRIKNESDVNLHLWDTAGTERFRSVMRSHYRDAHGVFLVYDITDRNSLQNLESWLIEVNQYVTPEEAVFMVVANKADSGGGARNSIARQGNGFANQHHFKFIETSAMKGINVEKAFRLMAENMYEKRMGLCTDVALSSESLYRTNESLCLTNGHSHTVNNPIHSPKQPAEVKVYNNHYHYHSIHLENSNNVTTNSTNNSNNRSGCRCSLT